MTPAGPDDAGGRAERWCVAIGIDAAGVVIVGNTCVGIGAAGAFDRRVAMAAKTVAGASASAELVGRTTHRTTWCFLAERGATSSPRGETSHIGEARAAEFFAGAVVGIRTACLIAADRVGRVGRWDRGVATVGTAFDQATRANASTSVPRLAARAFDRGGRGSGATGSVGISPYQHGAGQRGAAEPKQTLQNRPAAGAGSQRFSQRIEPAIIQITMPSRTRLCTK